KHWCKSIGKQSQNTAKRQYQYCRRRVNSSDFAPFVFRVKFRKIFDECTFETQTRKDAHHHNDRKSKLVNTIARCAQPLRNQDNKRISGQCTEYFKQQNQSTSANQLDELCI